MRVLMVEEAALSCIPGIPMIYAIDYKKALQGGVRAFGNIGLLMIPLFGRPPQHKTVPEGHSIKNRTGTISACLAIIVQHPTFKETPIQ